jgi:2-amino-4-hydroxy-6-hydroxymethyldihydropteridine diphosphokinase
MNVHITGNYSTFIDAMTKKATIYLALGSNLGDRLANLDSALASMPAGVKVLARSPVYETPPWGLTDQPDFLNMVVKGETRLSPLRLLARLKKLEKALGRTLSVLYGPRLIDIDILFYNDLVLDTPDLTIPHPHLHERSFVLVPLADLAADLVHPVLGQSIHQLLSGVDTTGVKPHG